MWDVDVQNCPTIHKWYGVSDELMGKIYQSLGTDQNGFHVKVMEILEWVKLQNDLPCVGQDPKFIGLMLLKNKFDGERVKQKIRGYFQTLAQYPHFFRNLSRISILQEPMLILPLPKLTSNFEGIGAFKMNPTNIAFSGERYLQTTVFVASTDYHLAKFTKLILIFDLENFSFEHFTQITPKIIMDGYKIWRNVLPVSVVGIHFLNASSVINSILGLARLTLPDKLVSRIVVHENLETLHASVPKSNLPSDWGGDLGSIEELAGEFEDIMDESGTLYERIRNFVPPPPISDKYDNGGVFGAQGNFKSLCVD